MWLFWYHTVFNSVPRFIIANLKTSDCVVKTQFLQNNTMQTLVYYDHFNAMGSKPNVTFHYQIGRNLKSSNYH